MDYEIYEGRTEGQNRKKTYLVFDKKTKADRICQAKHYFRVSTLRIGYTDGWILNNELYFENPGKKGAKKVIVYFYA